MANASSLGSLFVVATPIGNLDDLTHRAETVLKSVQIVAAEDTRRTSVLLAHIGHRAPELLSLHEHNEGDLAPKLIARLQAGVDIALVSDAGTPLINDPGFGLVGQAHRAGIPTIPVPGACSITTLLSVCPLPCQPFQFIGFLASKVGQRKAQLEHMLAVPEATVFLESPKRIRGTLSALQELGASRPLMLGRELTKKFESQYVGSASQLLDALDDEPRGEFIGVLAAETQTESQSFKHVEGMRALLQELSPAQASRLGATICGVKKKQMYDLAMTLGQE